MRLTLCLAITVLLFNGAVAQSNQTGKFVFVSVTYEPNGEFMGASYGSLFESAKDCDRYTAAAMKKNIDFSPNSYRVSGNGSMLLTTDDSGSFWFGCVPQTKIDTPELVKYFNIHMNDDIAKKMVRFPKLG